MFKWIKNKLGIIDLENEIKLLKFVVQQHEKFVERKIAELQEYTRVDADIGMRGNNTIVLTGVYKKQGYVKFYDVGNGEFAHLVEMLKDMKGIH